MKIARPISSICRAARILAGRRSKMRLLLVEDASRLREIVQKRLREQGYAVDAVASGSEAVQAGLQSRYDAIVLDLGLPDIDGMEVCERLRAANCRAPIVMLTARDEVEARVQGLDVGA